MTLEATLLIAAALFAIGLYGAISQQVVVMVMMGLELMINALILAAAGFWWFLAKTYTLLLIMMWARWTFPRVRFDMLLNLNWKWLLPLGVINLLATAFFMKL